MVKDNASRLHSQLVTDTGPCLIAKQRHATQLLVSREQPRIVEPKRKAGGRGCRFLMHISAKDTCD